MPRKPPAYERIAQMIRDRIRLGFYERGSPAPAEQQLMAEFGVSRPTAVRALDLITREGWLHTQRGKGRRITSDPQHMEDMFTQHGARQAWQRQGAQAADRLRAFLGESGMPTAQLIVADTILDQIEDLFRDGPQL